ncbi:MAG: VOC family protein [Pseudomonadota bacterium]
MTALRAMPVLTTADPEALAAFFSDALGFHLAGLRRDETGAASFGIVFWGAVTVALQRGDAAPPTEGWSLYVYVSDLRDFAMAAGAGGAALLRGPEDTSYGCREVELATPEGHRLVFAQDLDPGPAGPGL